MDGWEGPLFWLAAAPWVLLAAIIVGTVFFLGWIAA